MAKIPAVYNFSIVQGADHLTRFQAVFKTADGTRTPYNLTGYTVAFTAKRQKTDLDADRVIDITDSDASLDIQDAANGIIDFKPNAATTGAYTFINAFFDLTLTSSGGTPIVTPLITGRLTINRGT